MRRRSRFWVGLDVHAASIYVAVLNHKGELTEWHIEHTPSAVQKLIRRLKELDEVRCCYEAGACGFHLMRVLSAGGIDCVVVAPALIPKRSGDRVKTDRRDARNLAKLLRADLLTPVFPPTPAQEAARDLDRARGDAREDCTRAQDQLSKFLLRHGRRWPKKQWTKAHRAWLAAQTFAIALQKQTYDAYVHALSSAEERLKSLIQQVAALAETDEYRPAVGILRCFRGIDISTAMTILVELGDITRFDSAPKLMAFLGITPSEHTSGGPSRRRPGSITKTGNRHVRTALTEAAWHYRHGSAIGRNKKRLRLGQPLWAIAIADGCQRRLSKKRAVMLAKGKKATVVNTAIARELSGFVWAALRQLASEMKAA